MPSQLVSLADDSHPDGPLQGDALDAALGAKRAVLESVRSWPTARVASIPSSDSLTPLLAEKTLGRGELMRDRRLERPIVGGSR